MRHSFLVVTVKKVKIGVHLLKLSQKWNRVITVLPPCSHIRTRASYTDCVWQFRYFGIL